jgi:hypothetical protein
MATPSSDSWSASRSRAATAAGDRFDGETGSATISVLKRATLFELAMLSYSSLPLPDLLQDDLRANLLGSERRQEILEVLVQAQLLSSDSTLPMPSPTQRRTVPKPRRSSKIFGLRRPSHRGRTLWHPSRFDGAVPLGSRTHPSTEFRYELAFNPAGLRAIKTGASAKLACLTAEAICYVGQRAAKRRVVTGLASGRRDRTRKRSVPKDTCDPRFWRQRSAALQVLADRFEAGEMTPETSIAFDLGGAA